MKHTNIQPRAAGQAAQLFATLDTHAGLFLTRLNPDGLTKRIVARFDRDSTAEEQTEVLRACNSHAALVAALEDMTDWADRCGQVASNVGALNRTVALDGALVKARAALAAAKE